MALVKDSAKYTRGINSFLEVDLWPKDLVGNCTIFSGMAFKVNLQIPLLVVAGLGSNLTTTFP
jgi:hypothetical protein